MIQQQWPRFKFWFLLSAVCCLLCATNVFAQVPKLIRYQGHLEDAQGVPLEGPYTLTFRLYGAATGGTSLWTEPQPSVPISAGSFSVLLGSVTPLDTMDWSAPSWLSIQVNSAAELTPRQQITSVPLALRAETAEIVKTSGLTDDANSLVPAGAIILWTSASCPAGYSRITALDDRFLVSGGTYQAAAGGSTMHSHGPGSYTTPSHSHGSSTANNTATRVGSGGADNQYLEPLQPHNHAIPTEGPMSITGTSAAVDGRPPFATVLLCQKD